MTTDHPDVAASVTTPASCGFRAPEAEKAPAAIESNAETVNEAMARDPRTTAVFNEFGIDACCGAGASITDAAVRDGVDLVALRAALDALPMLP